MGVLDDAIREHLDLKRRRGASDEEVAQAEAEALGPARRPAAPADDGETAAEPAEKRVIEPVDDVAPPPEPKDEPPREGTRALHDIDEDPTAPPAPVERASLDVDTVEHPAPPGADPPEAEEPGGQRRL
jgi:hypothetical protein